ncbi:hypothetical protein U9M48_037742 [Paspalum notatum var. saurae]|uniref:Reverse transcriptase domain-containing protein n=1 Tax=Paspalum notatum var. saurae TaxID=547442 RepID=A0AAQ3UKG9_PASNO
MAAFRAFYLTNGRSFSCLNSGLVVLLPKRQGASTPGDYRPIAMIHSFSKLVSKVLALRLAPFMKLLVRPNQTAFIRGRSILDSLKFVQCAAALFRKRRIPKMLFKLDISKAFDSLSWAFLLEVLAALGFNTRWHDWISILLSSALSQVLVNGSPSAKISHRRGVSQGDSLSPLLFVLAMDCLNRLIEQAVEAGALKRLELSQVKYHCSLYADDVILFASPTLLEASALKSLLHSFGVASGLSANLSKCSVTPISVPADDLVPVANALDYTMVDFPITYLGLLLSSSVLSRSQLHKLVDVVANRLPAALGPMLTRSGRLVWIKSVLTAVPLYAMMSDKLLDWACKEIEAICRRFFWAGKCAVSWAVVARPTTLGGLGWPTLSSLKENDRAWSALPIKVRKEARALFEASTLSVVGNGNNTLFWTDRWINGRTPSAIAPILFKFVRARAKRTRTVAEALPQRRWVSDIDGGLSVAAIVDYLRLWDALDGVNLVEVKDRIVWRWTSSGDYSAKSAYKKRWAPLRVRIFAWLACRGRLWTADRRRRHGLDANEHCFLCAAEPESCLHLLAACSYTSSVWTAIAEALSLPAPSSQGVQSIMAFWRRGRRRWPRDLRKGFDSLFMLVAWQLWKERNERCFRVSASS